MIRGAGEWTRPEGPPVLVVDRAGRGLLRRVLEASPGPPATVCVSSDPWQLAADVRRAVEDGVRFFVCVGGEGGFLAVAAGSAGHGGILVGFGGGCASLPRCFGLPAEPERACRHLKGTGEAALDTIRVTPRRGEPVEVANALWWGFGRVAGFVAGPGEHWRLGLRCAGLALRRDGLRLVTGDVTRDLDASGLLVANGQYLGDLDVVPRAHPGDGRLEVLAFTGPARDVWRMLPRLPTGSHLPHPRVVEIRPRALEIEGHGRLWADRAAVGSLPARVEAVPGRLRVAV